MTTKYRWCKHCLKWETTVECDGRRAGRRYGGIYGIPSHYDRFVADRAREAQREGNTD